MNSTQRVVENHIQRFREGDLEGVLEDFSPEAVVFTRARVMPENTFNLQSLDLGAVRSDSLSEVPFGQRVRE